MDEAKARQILGDWIKPDELYCLAPYVSAESKEGGIILDGDFDEDQLEALAWWMRNKLK